MTITTDAGQIRVESGKIVPFSFTARSLMGVARFEAGGQKLDITSSLDVMVFADMEFYFLVGEYPKPEVEPFLLKGDVEKYVEELRQAHHLPRSD